MKEPKPIFIIHVPNHYDNVQFANIARSIGKDMHDNYHVMFVQDVNDNFKFELFNPNIELNEIDIQELKDKLDFKRIYDSQHKSSIPKNIND